jgi:hypothetical protein
MGESLVDVYIATGEAEAHIVKGKLEAAGIPCCFDPMPSGLCTCLPSTAWARIRIAVNESMADEALKILKDESQSLEDGEDVPGE